jgi:hypothetical protein
MNQGQQPWCQTRSSQHDYDANSKTQKELTSAFVFFKHTLVYDRLAEGEQTFVKRVVASLQNC